MKEERVRDNIGKALRSLGTDSRGLGVKTQPPTATLQTEVFAWVMYGGEQNNIQYMDNIHRLRK